MRIYLPYTIHTHTVSNIYRKSSCFISAIHQIWVRDCFIERMHPMCAGLTLWCSAWSAIINILFLRFSRICGLYCSLSQFGNHFDYLCVCLAYIDGGRAINFYVFVQTRNSYPLRYYIARRIRLCNLFQLSTEVGYAIDVPQRSTTVLEYCTFCLLRNVYNVELALLYKRES